MEVTLPAWMTDGHDTGPLPEHKPTGDVVAYIYGLVDPETEQIRYIGKSIRPAERLENHINEPPSNCHRSHWLQKLKRAGLRPGIVIIESVVGAWPWQESERFWIAYGRKQGWPLTNNTSGGDGVQDLAPEARARIVAAGRGRKHTPAELEKMRIASTGRVFGPESRAKQSAAFKGRAMTWGAKIAEVLRKLSPDQETEVRLRLSAGEKVKDIAREFGMHRTSISKVKKGTYRGK
jgi:hypothetical protein